MTSYVALLRAINLGAASTIRKEQLIDAATTLGYARPRTFIASGNLLFDTDAHEAAVKTALSTQLAAQLGRPVAVIVRTAAEMARIRDDNPFPAASGNRVLVTMLDAAPPADALEYARHLDGEEMALGTREIYVRYTDDGMGRSKLTIPAAAPGTARNMNTVAKLAALLA
ncbi:DUF1697 domain-containing protein [Sphingomonas sp.]|jgi:uncharacterized protein (DUF1697 family)|uniref:DUF1697 domain-containing protein n=1 Tax=Sphingomonas sp. TaxID=28214 RepID=UPI002D7FBD4B|nr:DUF1697 domain-containing protein [Sphingomonas sp.]HEU0044427.1 DUF1697 domain-containing protein [Sphingomonas sp.]